MGVAAVNGFTARRKHERVSLAPVKNLTTGFSFPKASGHEEQLTGRIRMGAQGPMIQPNEVAAEGWTGGRAFAIELRAEVQRHQFTAAPVKETGGETAIRDSADQPLLQRVGCRAVVKELGLGAGGSTCLWGDRHPVLNTTRLRRSRRHPTSLTFTAVVATLALR